MYGVSCDASSPGRGIAGSTNLQRDGDRVVTWGDLLEIDNTADRDGLWRYWITLAEQYAVMGVDGFRCDAAYKVPGELWRTLISTVKRHRPGVTFFAESLGCPFEDTVRLAQSGFDYIFNSAKWWDFTAPWCLEQYRQTAPLVPSVSFPESHDTERLAAELNGDQAAVKMRYSFAALFAAGVMMPIGFEYGFRKRLHVVKTRSEDWETPAWDICDFIARVNRLKQSRRVFNEEGAIDLINLGNANLFTFVKWSRDRRERALIIINKDRSFPQLFSTQGAGQFLSNMPALPPNASSQDSIERPPSGRRGAMLLILDLNVRRATAKLKPAPTDSQSFTR